MKRPWELANSELVTQAAEVWQGGLKVLFSRTLVGAKLSLPPAHLCTLSILIFREMKLFQEKELEEETAAKT